MPVASRKPTRTARGAAARALADAASQFPDLAPSDVRTTGLDGRDSRLAVAIHRLALQRWLTIEYILDLFLRKPAERLEPALRGVLLAGGAQLLFMDRLPVHAVVDESVALARTLVRPGAGGLTNAVLRRVASLVEPTVQGEAWSPAADRLPIEGGFVPLADAVLPAPRDWSRHLAVATGCPQPLVQSWADEFGEHDAKAIALASIRTAPTIAAVESGFDLSAAEAASLASPHDTPGYLVWTGEAGELAKCLAQHPARRVQDPAAALAVDAAADLDPPPAAILDLCAGRGTKTRQLAVTFPNAHITATDTNPQRLADLRQAIAPHQDLQDRITIHKPGPASVSGPFDLVLVDAPCSNTAVLARRPEARYRFGRGPIASLVKLQREILEQAIRRLKPGGHLLYTTCSLDPQENAMQSEWACARWHLQSVKESLTLPANRSPDAATDASSRDRAYHDGAYHALLRKPG